MTHQAGQKIFNTIRSGAYPRMYKTDLVEYIKNTPEYRNYLQEISCRQELRQREAEEWWDSVLINGYPDDISRNAHKS